MMAADDDPADASETEMTAMATMWRRKAETQERWANAAARAVAEGIEVRQLAGSGMWVATSGSDASVAYELDVTGAVAHGCACLAGLNGDPVCKHRAAFYLRTGALAAPSTESTSAPDAAIRDPWGESMSVDPNCRACGGTGYVRYPTMTGSALSHWEDVPCADCRRRARSTVGLQTATHSIA